LRRISLGVAVALAAACGKAGNSDENVGGARNDGFGDNRGCEQVDSTSLWGKPYDSARDCIDVDHPLEDVACQVRPTAGSPDEFRSVGFACLERLADARQFWVFSLHDLGFDEQLWRRCPNEPPLAPKACYASGCPSAPRSLCSLEETRQEFNCSRTGEYDESCCGRQECSSSTECAPGQECRSVLDSVGQWYCWDSPSGCDCGGPFGGPPRRLCMPN